MTAAPIAAAAPLLATFTSGACSNGVRIEYDDWGEGAPVLLSLPGWCVSRRDFAAGDGYAAPRTGSDAAAIMVLLRMP